MCSGRGKLSFLGVSYQQSVRTQEATCITSPTGALLPTPLLWVSVTHGRTCSCWKQHIVLLWSECLDCGPPHIHKTLTQSILTFLLIPRSPPGPGSTYYKAPRLRGLLGQPAQQPQPGAFCWVMFRLLDSGLQNPGKQVQKADNLEFEMGPSAQLLKCFLFNPLLFWLHFFAVPDS